MKDDTIAKGMHFGCGGALGFLVGLFIFLKILIRSEWSASWLIIPLCVVIFGLVSMFQGDRFWGGLGDQFSDDD